MEDSCEVFTSLGCVFEDTKRSAKYVKFSTEEKYKIKEEVILNHKAETPFKLMRVLIT